MKISALLNKVILLNEYQNEPFSKEAADAVYQIYSFASNVISAPFSVVGNSTRILHGVTSMQKNQIECAPLVFAFNVLAPSTD